MARKRSFVEAFEIACSSRPGSFPIALPSLGSATASEAFFSSFKVFNSVASEVETLPSVRLAASATATAAESNFWNCFSFSLFILLVTLFRSPYGVEQALQ